MGLLEKKIDDTKFLNVIRKMAKAGYVEEWKYHNTYSGTPQGGIVSPILANIYLHELDCYVEALIADFTKGEVRSVNREWKKISSKASRLNKDIKQEVDQEARSKLLEYKTDLLRQTLEMPSMDQQDQNYKRLRYRRYADDFVLSAICSKSEAEEIYRKIACFLKEELKLNVSQAKSGLKHNTEIIRFLGYDITIMNTERIVKLIAKGQHYKKRTLKAQITFRVPEAKLQNFATKHGYGNWETMEAEHIPFLAHVSDVEMTLHYSAEMRGIARYYVLADNFSRAIGRLRILWIQSYLKSMGNKHKKSMQKVATMLNRGTYMAVRATGEKGKVREIKLFQLKDMKREATSGRGVDNLPNKHPFTKGSELLKRMDANQCEYCGKEGGYFEVHHVRKLADMKDGKQPWQKLMIARKRKTLVLCIDCHHRLTAGTLPDRRHFVK